jgi:hypothetical protein
MRWRMVDRIREVAPWDCIRGVKCVSLEEYDLLKPFGSAGVLPRSLVLESCVELVRRLVEFSSDFTQTGMPAGLSEFQFVGDAGMADALAITARVQTRSREYVLAQCEARIESATVARGAILLRLLPLAESFDPEQVRGMWRELHGAT